MKAFPLLLWLFIAVLKQLHLFVMSQARIKPVAPQLQYRFVVQVRFEIGIDKNKWYFKNPKNAIAHMGIMLMLQYKD